LGLARFAYALLLPPMRADLGWTYVLSGAMNTVNAAGYLAGALMMPRWLARFDGRHVVVAGGLGAALCLMLHGLTRDDAWLGLWRFGAGVASAASFAGGGVLAAQLAQRPDGVHRSGLILGIYYGGVGLGIVLSALCLPLLLQHEGLQDWRAAAVPGAAAWQFAWWALAALSLLATVAMARGSAHVRCPPVPAGERLGFRWRELGWGLAGYTLFGLGYIGYMTFVISLLREQGYSPQHVSGFYAVLGLGVMASSFLWAGLLQRHRGGLPMAVLNGLLGVATALLVWAQSYPVALLSGALFGAVFVSVVASTTAMVRHNLPKAAWPAGIAAFTIVFAAGQIVGPLLVGFVADAAGGGLAPGFWVSAALLALGSVVAARQRGL